MKTFTVVSSDASKLVYETEATTVGQLRKELEANGIDLSNKAIFEGLTRLELTNANDDTVLPHDVNYKGNVTDNLVFMITPNKKNIKSGMDRKEVMQAIKNHNLADKVKEIYGRNYTQVSTQDLVCVLEKYIPQPSAKADEHDEEENSSCYLYVAISALVKMVKKCGCEEMLLDILTTEGILTPVDDDDKEDDEDEDDEKVPAGSYSNKEIEEMFN